MNFPVLPAGAMNQFTMSGAVLVLMGGIMAYLKGLPSDIWFLLTRQLTVYVTVKDDDKSFVWVKEWMLDQEFIKHVRRVDLDSTLRKEMDISLIPSPGTHFFWHKKRPFWIEFKRSDEKKQDGYSAKRSESFALRTLGRKQSVVLKLVEEIKKSHHKSLQNESRLMQWITDYWYDVKGYRPRKLESIVLGAGEKEKLLEAVDKFLTSKEKYDLLGIPYHYGIGLNGPPGTGKTSLASAIAGRLGWDVYTMSLSEMSDSSLKQAMRNVPENSVIVFEDIDAMGVGEKRKKDDSKEKKDGDTMRDLLGVTLSGLLNVLDGFNAPSGVIYVMTTNHIDNLDPALLRPGRVDYRLYLGKATEHQKVELFKRFFPEVADADALSAVQERPSSETMAEFQGHLLSAGAMM
jgi:chaperone BCS1